MSAKTFNDPPPRIKVLDKHWVAAMHHADRDARNSRWEPSLTPRICAALPPTSTLVANWRKT